MTNNDILKIKQQLSQKGLKRFAYIKIDLGTPLKLLKDEANKENKLLLEDKKIKEHDCRFDCDDIERLKGINYGSSELSFLHPAILITNIPKNKLPPDVVMVVPMVSSTPNSLKYKSSYHDFEIHREYHNNLANPFLDNSSILRLGELRTIGIERINIAKTLKSNEQSFKLLWHKDRDKLIENLVNVITAK